MDHVGDDREKCLGGSLKFRLAGKIANTQGMVSEKQLFIVVRRYGPPYDAERALKSQSEWEAHRVFMNALEAEGIVRLGGPLEGAGEVLLVFRAAEAEEIEQWLANDPWTRSGILSTTRIVPWNLRIGKIA